MCQKVRYLPKKYYISIKEKKEMKQEFNSQLKEHGFIFKFEVNKNDE